MDFESLRQTADMKRKPILLKLLALLLVTAALADFYYRFSKDNKRSMQKCSTPKAYDESTQKRSIDRHREIVSKALHSDPRVVLVGDSLTERWEQEGKSPWLKYLAPHSAFNVGIDNDRTENVLWRLQHGCLDFRKDPDICVLLIGINNLGGDRDTPAGVVHGIRAVAKSILDKLPNSELLIVSLLPCGPHSRGFLSKRSRINRALSDINLPRTRVVDFSSHFLNEKGGLETTLSTDALHLSEEGYELFGKLLSDCLTQ